MSRQEGNRGGDPNNNPNINTGSMKKRQEMSHEEGPAKKRLRLSEDEGLLPVFNSLKISAKAPEYLEQRLGYRARGGLNRSGRGGRAGSNLPLANVTPPEHGFFVEDSIQVDGDGWD